MELHACYFKDLGAFSTDQRRASATAGKTGTRATGQRNWPTHPAVPPGTDDQNSTPARELEPPQPLLRSLDGGQHPCAKIGAKGPRASHGPEMGPAVCGALVEGPDADARWDHGRPGEGDPARGSDLPADRQHLPTSWLRRLDDPGISGCPVREVRGRCGGPLRDRTPVPGRCGRRSVVGWSISGCNYTLTRPRSYTARTADGARSTSR